MDTQATLTLSFSTEGKLLTETALIISSASNLGTVTTSPHFDTTLSAAWASCSTPFVTFPIDSTVVSRIRRFGK